MAKRYDLTSGAQLEVAIDDYDFVAFSDKPKREGATTKPDALGRVFTIAKCHALQGGRWLVCANLLPEYAETMPAEI